MAELKALLFDVDGTLANTEADGHRVAFNKAFVEAGLDWDWSVETYGKLLAVTGGKERIQFYVNDFLEDFDPGANLAEFAAQLHQSKTRYYLEMLQQGEIPLRTGVERFLNEAREAGYRLGIATTTTPANVTYLLSSTLGEASLGWFDVIAAGDIVPAKKPAPDIYAYALESMNIGAHEALAFEDSDNGLKSSLGANLKTIVTVNEYTREQDFSGAALVLDQMGEKGHPFMVLQGNAFDEDHMNKRLINKIFSNS